MAETENMHKSPAKRLAEFTQTVDGIKFLVPDDIIEALGWQDGDALDLSIDAAGYIVCRKVE